jgi:hypothetical protein
VCSLCRGAGEGERGVYGWRFGDFAALVPFGENDFRLRIAKFSWRELRDLARPGDVSPFDNNIRLVSPF